MTPKYIQKKRCLRSYRKSIFKIRQLIEIYFYKGNKGRKKEVLKFSKEEIENKKMNKLKKKIENKRARYDFERKLYD